MPLSYKMPSGSVFSLFHTTSLTAQFQIKKNLVSMSQKRKKRVYQTEETKETPQCDVSHNLRLSLVIKVIRETTGRA